MYVAAAPGQPAPLPTRENSIGSLEQLAARAQRFTPRVSLVPPDGLLLEVKGSLHLFNGVDGPAACVCLRLRDDRTRTRAGTRTYTVGRDWWQREWASHSLSPTRRNSSDDWRDAACAAALARMMFSSGWHEWECAPSGRPCVCREPVLRVASARCGWLSSISSRGRHADLRHSFQPRERFRRRRELICELENNESDSRRAGPAAGGSREIPGGTSVRRHAARVSAAASPCLAVECVLRLAAPAGGCCRGLTELLGERLDALILPEPVRSCELRSGPLVLRSWLQSVVAARGIRRSRRLGVTAAR